MLKRNLIFFTTLFLMVNCFAQSELPFRNVKLSNEERINDLLGRLTIEEKISLLITTSKGIDLLGVETY